VTALGVKIRPQELKTKDYRVLLQAVVSQWLPLAPATFRAIVEVIPPPPQAQSVRIPKMLHPDLPYHQTTVEPQNKLERDLYSGASGAEAFTIAYISKMFAVPADALPQNQRKPLTAEDMRQRGRASREAAAALAATGAIVVDQSKSLEATEAPGSADAPEEPVADATAEKQEEEVLLGFARLYSGTMRAGQHVYALLPKYDVALLPTHPRNSKFIVPVKVQYLYMMMGRDLVMVDEVPAGNVFAIAGLDGKILRNGTLCGVQDQEETAVQEAGKDRECFVNLAGLHMTVSRGCAGHLADGVTDALHIIVRSDRPSGTRAQGAL
jgi:ribosome assembly protein 1